MEVTLNLPKNILLEVSKFAKKTKRSLDEVVSERLQNLNKDKAENPLQKSSDAEVLEAAKLLMPKNQSNLHSELLYKNQANILTKSEKLELDFYQQIYRLALLRKAQGINEALRRGLIKSVDELK